MVWNMFMISMCSYLQISVPFLLHSLRLNHLHRPPCISSSIPHSWARVKESILNTVFIIWLNQNSYRIHITTTRTPDKRIQVLLRLLGTDHLPALCFYFVLFVLFSRIPDEAFSLAIPGEIHRDRIYCPCIVTDLGLIKCMWRCLSSHHLIIFLCWSSVLFSSPIRSRTAEEACWSNKLPSAARLSLRTKTPAHNPNFTHYSI